MIPLCAYPCAIPVLVCMSFLLWVICHSRTRCGNLFFFTTVPARCICYVPVPPRLTACAAPALHSRSSLFFARRADNAEAKAVAPEVGAAPVPVAHLAVAGVVAPAAATVIAVLAAVGIPAPFPYVTAHVV